ncbi:MAG: hypothetical protein JO190_11810 [Candidatus Eremiobacteraeota bacterium]|nr:hypothetical protein [Candidatus Eremiobacteraeota bacterium]
MIVASSVVALGGMLAGCSGSQSLVTPDVAPRGVPLSRTAQTLHLTLSGETLSASNASVTCSHHGFDYYASFQASGTAGGPVDGTFGAGGSWYWVITSSGSHWSFSEEFSIKARRHGHRVTISGGISGAGRGSLSCTAFDKSGLTYTWKNGGGNASAAITYAGHFSNNFQ